MGREPIPARVIVVDHLPLLKMESMCFLALRATVVGAQQNTQVFTRGCKASCPGSRTSSLTASALPPPPGLPLQLPLQLVLQPPSLLQQLAHQLPRLDKTMATTATMATTTMKVE